MQYYLAIIYFSEMFYNHIYQKFYKHINMLLSHELSSTKISYAKIWLCIMLEIHPAKTIHIIYLVLQGVSA